jgi:hypothetical protein
MNFTPKIRKRIYAISVAVVPILSILGYISDDVGRQILNAIAALLAIGTSSLAFKNVK